MSAIPDHLLPNFSQCSIVPAVKVASAIPLTSGSHLRHRTTYHYQLKLHRSTALLHYCYWHSSPELRRMSCSSKLPSPYTNLHFKSFIPTTSILCAAAPSSLIHVIYGPLNELYEYFLPVLVYSYFQRLAHFHSYSYSYSCSYILKSSTIVDTIF